VRRTGAIAVLGAGPLDALAVGAGLKGVVGIALSFGTRSTYFSQAPGVEAFG
jgi:hypothetical protein